MAEDFRKIQQLNLVNMAKFLSAQGIVVIISNHDTEFTRDIYQGAKFISLSVQCDISSKGSKRTKVAEIVASFQ